MRDGVSPNLAQVARVVARSPGLRVSIERYSDTADKQPLTFERAEAVRRAFLANGLSASDVSAVGLGNSRLIGPNTTAQEPRANCRVEIVISGEPIGRLAVWQQSYALPPSAQKTDTRSKKR